MSSSLGSHPWETGLVTTGAWREDEEDVVFGYRDFWDIINDKALISISHFWEADNGDYTENSFRVDYYGNSLTLPPKKNSFDKMMRFKDGGWTINCNHTLSAQKLDGANIIIPGSSIVPAKLRYNSLINLWKTGRMSLYTSDTEAYLYDIIVNEPYRSQFVWEILGRMCHLLQDLSVPAHSHVSAHFANNCDVYEDWIGDDSQGSRYLAYNSDNSGSLIDPTSSSNPVHYLMYILQQKAKCFATSEPYNFAGEINIGGNSLPEEITFLNDNHIIQWEYPLSRADAIGGYYNSNIREKLEPLSIRLTAGLFLWFAKEAGLLPSFVAKTKNNYNNLETENLPDKNGVVGVPVDISAPELVLYNDQYYNFMGWSDNINESSRQVINAADLTANYSLLQGTTNINGFKNSGQRKFIRTPDGVLHLVYENMDKIFYEISYDNGATWQKANGGRPLNVGYDPVFGRQIYPRAKHPSMDYDPYSSEYRVMIVWQQEGVVPGQCEIKYATMNNGVLQGSSIGSVATYSGSYDNDADPVIALKDIARGVVSYIRNDAQVQGIKCHFVEVDGNQGTISQLGEGVLSASSGRSKELTIAATRNLPDKFHVAWREENDIYYSDFNFIESGPIEYSLLESSPLNQSSSDTPLLGPWEPGDPLVLNELDSQVPSYYVGGIVNSNPSMVAATDGSARLAWKTCYYEGEEGFVVMANPKNYSYIPYLNKYYGDVYSPQISLGSQTYFIGWSEPYGDNYKNICTDSRTLRDMETLLYSKGCDMQINNGGTTDQMFVMALDAMTNSSVFTFNKSEAIGTIVANYKSNPVLSGRMASLKKGDVLFSFLLGDIDADGMKVDFKQVSDTVRITSIEQMNAQLESEPFTLNNNSKLSFGLRYGVKDSVKTLKSLKENEFISFRIEMVDAQSGEVLGSYMNVKLDKMTFSKDKESFFSVNPDGIGSRLVKLRLKLEENMDAELIVSDKFSGRGILSKSAGRKEINYKGSLEVKEYSLSQNYPNPFNPTTVINYELPKAAKVTLRIYDILGKEVATLVNDYRTEGRYSIEFNASNLPSGTYIYELRANDYVKSGKMMLLK